MMPGRGDYDAAVEDCLFCKIVAGEIPSSKVFEDDLTYAFRDIVPQASTHIVVVPKAHYPNAAAMADADPVLAGAVLTTGGAVAALDGVAESGYRLVFNTGPDANQTVFHVHLHVLGGRLFGWPPG
jgi:histidine triad (HIT) family protein